MMSEQQFEVFQECEYLEEWSSCPYCIKYDGETVFETLPLGIAKEVCKKLNEQQSNIQELERKLKKYAKIGEEQLKQIMELQDLCGQSDSENAKLRQEIKKLKQQRV